MRVSVAQLRERLSSEVGRPFLDLPLVMACNDNERDICAVIVCDADAARWLADHLPAHDEVTKKLDKLAKKWESL